jgi:uncharacterized protein
MAEHPNVETLERGYDAFGKGDMETLRSELFQPDIVWHQGGNNPTAGDYRGAEQVLGLFGNLFETTGGTFRVHLTSIVGDGDLVIGIGAASASRNGDTITEEPYAHVARVKDGKLAEAWIVNLNQDRVDQFYNG